MQQPVLKVLLFSALLTAGAVAQVTTATVYGHVQDPSGAGIGQTSVEIRNQSTAAVLKTQTSGAGEFTFTYVPVGRYTLTLAAPGFRGEQRDGIELNAGGNVRLNIQLEIGSVSESVRVTAEAPLINAVNAEQRTTVTESQIRELPSSRRDWTNLLRVNTGIAVGGETVTMNGMAPNGFSITVDGTAASSDTESPSLSQAGGFNTIKAVSTEAIEEVSVSKGIAPAEVGSMLSGNVNVITRGGSNSFHGSLFFNNQLEDYNARNQFLATKPPRTFNQYGGSFGGPILRNRLFFFGAYEGYQNRAFSTVSGNVPTAEFRAQAIAAVPAYKQAFDLYPLPNRPYNPGATNALYQGANSTSGQDNHAVVRGDYHIDSGNLLSARYTRSRPDQVEPRVVESNPRSFIGTNEVGTMSYTRSLSSWVFLSRFGYSRVTADRIDGLFKLGIADLRGAIGFNPGGGEVLNRLGDNISFEQTAAWTGGRHTIKFGGLFNRIASGRENIEVPRLTYSTLPDFFANIPGQFRITFGVEEFSVRMSQTGLFVQDDYKVSRNLILNVGLRWDYWGTPRERDGRLFNRGNQGYGDYLPSDSVLQPDRNNFAPRAGFAWTVDPSGKTVIRAGSGLFYSQRPIYGLQEMVLTSLDQPFRANLTRAEGIRLGLRFPFTNDQALQALRGFPDQSARTAFEESFPNPYSMQWLFSIQRQLPWAMVLETSYVANRVLKLNQVIDQNLPDRITGVRPVAGVGQFRLYQPAERSKYDSLQTSIRQRLSSGFLFSLHHTWSSNMSYSDGDLSLSARPQDNANIRADWGPTPFARRHRVVGEVLYRVPFRSFGSGAGRLVSQAIGGWQVGSILTATSGSFATVTQPTAFERSRADYIGGPATLDGWRDTLAFLNPAAFRPVPVSTASGAAVRGGSVGRNSIETPGSWTVDLSLGKTFSIREGLRIQIRADAFNALNHTNLGGLQTGINSSSFGRLTSAGSRSMQLNARLSF